MCVGKIEIFIYEFRSHFLSPFTLLRQRPLAYTLHCFMMRDFFLSPLTNFPLMKYQSENLFWGSGNTRIWCQILS